MRKKYLTPVFELFQIGTKNILSISDTITDIGNGDHMQSWWGN